MEMRKFIIVETVTCVYDVDSVDLPEDFDMWEGADQRIWLRDHFDEYGTETDVELDDYYEQDAEHPY